MNYRRALYAVLLWIAASCQSSLSAQDIQCLPGRCTVRDTYVQVEIPAKGQVLVSSIILSPGKPPKIPIKTIAANVGERRGEDIDELFTVDHVLLVLRMFVRDRMLHQPLVPGPGELQLLGVATTSLDELRNAIAPKLVAVLLRRGVHIVYDSLFHVMGVLEHIDPPRDETVLSARADNATKTAIDGLRRALADPDALIANEAARTLLRMQSVDDETLRQARARIPRQG
jgi:hypothetical protein